MKRIFKYSLEILDRQEVELPAGSKDPQCASSEWFASDLGDGR